MEWTKQKYNEQYEVWMPWIEDNFLRYFTKDNKASYATKGSSLGYAPPLMAWLPQPLAHQSHPTRPPTLSLRFQLEYWPVSPFATDQLNKTKVTGVEQVDTLQDGVHNLTAGQLGQGGLLQPVGDLASKEGINRTERQGKDDKGSYIPSVPGIPGLSK
jgi:hypothetical protein